MSNVLEVLDRVSPHLSGAAEGGLGRFGRKRQERVFRRAMSVGLFTVHTKACDILTHILLHLPVNLGRITDILSQKIEALRTDCHWSYLSMIFQ